MLSRAYTLDGLLILRLPQREQLNIEPPAELLAEVERLLALEDDASRGLQRFMQENFDTSETCWKELFQHNPQPPAMAGRRDIEATSSNQTPTRKNKRRFEHSITDTNSGKRPVAGYDTSHHTHGQTLAMESRGNVEGTAINQPSKQENKCLFQTAITDTNSGKRRVAGNETSVRTLGRPVAMGSRRNVEATTSNQSPRKKTKSCSETTVTDTSSGKRFVAGN